MELVVVDMVASCGDLEPGPVGARHQRDEAATPRRYADPRTPSGRGGMNAGGQPGSRLYHSERCIGTKRGRTEAILAFGRVGCVKMIPD
ncbi:hypothetical protein DV701_11295 [Ornithinimicrobium avium]|uniref:Uncharacterized protein n=1 Tax=Ornithinimicrobium avium TaxID=2283195 RepID=A0A345NNM2_9MICO|nr:hypothetical protein DV701_11295 [Ornithinimicrobium avium]